MKSKEEIEKVAEKDFMMRQKRGHYELSDLKSADYYHDGFLNGYTRCQEDISKLLEKAIEFKKNNMTSVEWLEDQIKNSKHYYSLMKETKSRGTIVQPNIFEQAKEMEKEQIEKAIEYGYQLRNNNKPINSGIDWVKEFNSLNK